MVNPVRCFLSNGVHASAKSKNEIEIEYRFAEVIIATASYVVYMVILSLIIKI